MISPIFFFSTGVFWWAVKATYWVGIGCRAALVSRWMCAIFFFLFFASVFFLFFCVQSASSIINISIAKSAFRFFFFCFFFCYWTAFDRDFLLGWRGLSGLNWVFFFFYWGLTVWPRVETRERERERYKRTRRSRKWRRRCIRNESLVPLQGLPAPHDQALIDKRKRVKTQHTHTHTHTLTHTDDPPEKKKKLGNQNSVKK